MRRLKKFINTFLVMLIGPIVHYLISIARQYDISKMRKRANVHPTVRLGDVQLDPNVTIDEHTYFNSGQITTGERSEVRIGKYCAIGHNVRIKARDHHPLRSTSTGRRPHTRVEGNISIGDYTWIGDNVFIKYGVSVGSNSVIGANSVVTKDVPNNSVVAGSPARILYKKPAIEDLT